MEFAGVVFPDVLQTRGEYQLCPELPFTVGGFRDGVRRLTDGRGVDVVVHPVGGDRFTDSPRSLAREGRLVILGFTGREIPTVKVNRLLLTNTTVMGLPRRSSGRPSRDTSASSGATSCCWCRPA